MTFEEWRATKKRLDVARHQLETLITTFQKRTRDLEDILETGQLPNITYAPSPGTSITLIAQPQSLAVTPTEEQITTVINEFIRAVTAEN